MNDSPLTTAHGDLTPGKSCQPLRLENSSFSLKSYRRFDVAGSIDVARRPLWVPIICYMKNNPFVVERHGLDPVSHHLPLWLKNILFSLKLRRIFDVAGSSNAFIRPLLFLTIQLPKDGRSIVENDSFDQGTH